MIRYLFPNELSELSHKRREFEKARKGLQDKHKHQWEKTFIHLPPALLNTRAYNTCVTCGEMVQIPVTDQMSKEIHFIISEKSEAHNKSKGKK